MESSNWMNYKRFFRSPDRIEIEKARFHGLFYAGNLSRQLCSVPVLSRSCHKPLLLPIQPMRMMLRALQERIQIS